MLATMRVAPQFFQSLRTMYGGGAPQQPAHAQPQSGAPPQPVDYVALSTQHVYIGEEGNVPMVARVSVCGACPL